MADAPANPTPAPEAPAAKPSLLGRVLALVVKLRKQPVRAAVVMVPVAIIGALVLWYSLFSGRSAQKATLELALEKLQAGELAEARRLAAEVRSEKHESFADVGGAFYVLGAVMAEDAAAHENPQERQTLHLIAARYLEESRIRGFPPEQELQGILLLGRSLHHGGRFQSSLPILKEALAKNTAAKGEILYLLADSYLHLSPPNLPQSSAHARKLLAEKHVPPEVRDRGLLLLGRISLADGKYDEGRAFLEKLAPKSAAHRAGVLLSIRLLCEEVLRGNGKLSERDKRDLNKSLRVLTELRGQRIPFETIAQVDLLTALSQDLVGKYAEASATWGQLRKSRFGSAESVAAAFYEADSLLRRHDTAESVTLYKKGLTEAGPPETYQNDWLPRDVLQGKLIGVLERLLGESEFSAAESLAASLTPLFPEELAAIWRAKAEHEWAMHLQAAGSKPGPAISHSAYSEPGHDASSSPLPHVAKSGPQAAREHFRKAAAHYERLAELRIATSSYLDDLKDSARDYLAGQSYSRATAVFRKFLKEDPQNGQQEAKVGLGEALLAIGETAEGLKTLEDEIAAYPRHPATYRARYLVSVGYEEQGNVAQARKHLSDNLYNFSLTPESNDWRDSIFLLGQLIYHDAMAREAKSRELGVDLINPEHRKAGLKELGSAHELFQEAARILEEAIERYPAAPDSPQARYCLADAHRQSARWPRKRIEGTSIEATRTTLNQEMQTELAASLKEYLYLIEHLSAERDGQGSSATDRAILRNSYFARADVLFDQGNLEEAAAAYSAATSRYQHDPEALEAYVQLAACYRRLGRAAEARGTLEQARVVLARMKPETNFTNTTPYSRDQWTLLLARLVAL